MLSFRPPTFPDRKKLSDYSLEELKKRPLLQTWFLMTREFVPDISWEKTQKTLEIWIKNGPNKIQTHKTMHEKIDLLNDYFFDILGFQANQKDYYHPHNSFLNQVLEQKTGIPITLSLLYKILAENCGLTLEGVAFPGHFLLLCEEGTGNKKETFWLDVFHGGKILTEELCAELFKKMFEKKMEFRPDFLKPSTNIGIFQRLLNNLKYVYLKSRDSKPLLHLLNLLMQFDPDSGEILKERGLVHYQMECYRAAHADLSVFLKTHPDHPQREELTTLISKMGKEKSILH